MVFASTSKEECSFCGTEVASNDGEFIEVMPMDQTENNSALRVQFARWACNACIAEYKEYMKDGE